MCVCVFLGSSMVCVFERNKKKRKLCEEEEERRCDERRRQQWTQSIKPSPGGIKADVVIDCMQHKAQPLDELQGVTAC